jgi:hypothetical protein
MSEKRSKLSIRIPWLLEAVAEGSIAIFALVALALFAFASKSFGLW